MAQLTSATRSHEIRRGVETTNTKSSCRQQRLETVSGEMLAPVAKSPIVAGGSQLVVRVVVGVPDLSRVLQRPATQQHIVTHNSTL